MWKIAHVATNPEEACVITQFFDEQGISYEIEPGAVSGTVEVLVQENDLQAAQALVRNLSSLAPEPLPSITEKAPRANELLCLRCSVPLRRVGPKSLRVGYWMTRFMDVEVYTCPRCRRLEFFQPTIPD